MFSTNHVIWIIICIILIIIGTICIKKYKPSFKTIIDIAFYTAISSELIKVLSVVEMVPIAGKQGLYPYMELRYLPLHLCSLHILFFAYLKINKKRNEITRWLLSFMYPCCIVGGILAIIIPSIFSTSIKTSEAFTHPLAYQTFLYHTMLVLFGIYLFDNKEAKLTADGYKKCMILLFALSFVSIYINSIFTIPVYENGQLISVASTTNFFFVSTPPIPVLLNEKIHWFIYLLILVVLATVLVGLLYLPMFIKKRKIEKI